MEEKKFRFGENGCIVCDPCYVLNKRDYHEIWGDKYHFANGIIETFMMVASTGGDGCYETQHLEPNRAYYIPVDSGTIAIVNRSSLAYDKEKGDEIIRKEDGIAFEGSGWGEIKVVEEKIKRQRYNKYLSVYLKFDDGRCQDFTILLPESY